LHPMQEKALNGRRNAKRGGDSDQHWKRNPSPAGHFRHYRHFCTLRSSLFGGPLRPGQTLITCRQALITGKIRPNPKRLLLARAFRKHASQEAKVPANGLLALFLTAAVAHGGSAVGRPVIRVLIQTEGTLAGDPQTLGEIVQGAREIWRPYADVTFDVT